jgi:hypothetical protein
VKSARGLQQKEEDPLAVEFLTHQVKQFAQSPAARAFFVQTAQNAGM